MLCWIEECIQWPALEAVEKNRNERQKGIDADCAVDKLSEDLSSEAQVEQ